jgi:periplasmic copper chaperone A
LDKGNKHVKCTATIRFSLLLMAALSLPSCRQSDDRAPPAQETAEAAPDAKPGLSASGGTLVLPAVEGRPGVAYFELRNDSESAAEVAAVHIEGALRAEMHETTGGKMAKLDSVVVPAGERVAFVRGGRHVMAFDLSKDLKPGGKTEMTLSFADGDKLSAPLTIEAMGGAGHTGDGEAH